MFAHIARIAPVALLFILCAAYANFTASQEVVQPRPSMRRAQVPNGVEVQVRGPVHEAFATPLTEAAPMPLLNKKPPLPIEEMPPEEKPDGNVAWIGGYFAWDDDRADYLWVSGCWRVKPDNKEWVPGYWREVGERWQWVPGFWTAVHEQKAQPVTYYPEPPAPPAVAPPGDPRAADTFHIPGYWMWNGERYVWRAGYWTRIRPGYVYVPSHYRWTPYGYVFVGGYWDLQVARRGVLYAPIYVNTVVVGPRYVYTPYYAVRNTIVLDTLFVRASFGSYYFGDYYGPRYVGMGFEPCVVYSRRHYEPIIVYERWHYRDNPRWYNTQLTLVVERNAGRAPVPPRTVNVTNVNVTNVTNVTNINNVNSVVSNTKNVVAAQGQKTVALDRAARAQVHQTSQATHQVLAADRRKVEATPVSGSTNAPRTSALHVPAAQKRKGPVPRLPTKTPPLTKIDGGKTTLPDAKVGHPSVTQPPPHDAKTVGRPLDNPKKSSPPEKKKKTGF